MGTVMLFTLDILTNNIHNFFEISLFYFNFFPLYSLSTMPTPILSMLFYLFSVDDVVIEEEIDHELLAEAENAWAQREWSIQHVLFPALRLFFKPPTSMATDGTFVQVPINIFS